MPIKRRVSGGELIRFLLSKGYVIIDGDDGCNVVLSPEADAAGLDSWVNINNAWIYDPDVAASILESNTGINPQELWEYLDIQS
ncbi:MAG: hypothetical protein QY871_00455 [Dehalococcoides mccartyi]|uniref:hypothetical protein n=1 Tax=Dehalococcoides mccartyi TaxID=61435 RepID=UPI0025CA1438|nr:hypothetical protein [Dehalococcoides mccartyi]MDN4185538.1 hypothetical protein [Dehalococcoides mccartyi]